MNKIQDLYWHCLHCGDHTAVEQTTPEYVLGERGYCKCGGTMRVVTTKLGAAYEQGRAMGMDIEDAWERARSKVPHA